MSIISWVVLGLIAGFILVSIRAEETSP